MTAVEPSITFIGNATLHIRFGVELLRLVRPRTTIPIHFDDYDLFSSPLSEFQAEVHAAGLDDQVAYLQRGAVTCRRS